MILAGKYEVLDRVGGAAITVDRARNTLSGGSVFLHRLVAGSAFAADAMKLALKYVVRHPDNAVVLDVFEDSDCTYLVTNDSPEYNSLLDFLPLALAGGNTVPQRSAPRADLPPASPSAQRLTPLRETRIASPGEFTRMFNAAPEGVRPNPSPSVQRPVPEPSLPSTPPGEFTRMFSNPLSSPGTKDEILPPSFSPPKGGPSGSGEFTRLFGTEAPAASVPSDAVRDILEEKPPPIPAVPAGSRPGPSGPGEFTRIISRDTLSKPEVESQAPERPQPVPSAPKLPPPAPQSRLKSKGVSPVLILIAALLIAAIAVVVFFMLRR